MSFPCKPISSASCFNTCVDLSVGSIFVPSAEQCWKTSNSSIHWYFQTSRFFLICLFLQYLLDFLDLLDPGVRTPNNVKTKGIQPLLIDPTQVESKKSSYIQWPVPSINAEPVDIFLGE